MSAGYLDLNTQGGGAGAQQYPPPPMAMYPPPVPIDGAVIRTIWRLLKLALCLAVFGMVIAILVKVVAHATADCDTNTDAEQSIHDHVTSTVVNATQWLSAHIDQVGDSVCGCVDDALALLETHIANAVTTLQTSIASAVTMLQTSIASAVATLLASIASVSATLTSVFTLLTSTSSVLVALANSIAATTPACTNITQAMLPLTIAATDSRCWLLAEDLFYNASTGPTTGITVNAPRTIIHFGSRKYSLAEGRVGFTTLGAADLTLVRPYITSLSGVQLVTSGARGLQVGPGSRATVHHGRFELLRAAIITFDANVTVEDTDISNVVDVGNFNFATGAQVVGFRHLGTGNTRMRNVRVNALRHNVFTNLTSAQYALAGGESIVLASNAVGAQSGFGTALLQNVIASGPLAILTGRMSNVVLENVQARALPYPESLAVSLGTPSLRGPETFVANNLVLQCDNTGGGAECLQIGQGAVSVVINGLAARGNSNPVVAEPPLTLSSARPWIGATVLISQNAAVDGNRLARNIQISNAAIYVTDRTSYGVAVGNMVRGSDGVLYANTTLTLRNTEISGGAAGVFVGSGARSVWLDHVKVERASIGVVAVNGSRGLLMQDSFLYECCVGVDLRAGSRSHLVKNTAFIENHQDNYVDASAGSVLSSSNDYLGETGDSCDSAPVLYEVAADNTLVARNEASTGTEIERGPDASDYHYLPDEHMML